MSEYRVKAWNDKEYVLECDHASKTYSGLGRVQRSILDYLATAPGGFKLAPLISDGNRLLDHGAPYGSTVAEIATAVYRSEPTTTQIRVIQRNLRRLQTLEYIWCRHAAIDWSERHHTNWRAEDVVSPRPVSGLVAGLRWDCEHLRAEKQRQQEREARQQAEGEAFTARMAALSGADAIAMLTGVIGGAP